MAWDLDKVERSAKLVREALILAVSVYIAWYAVPFIPKFASQLKNADIEATDVELPGIKLKLKQAVGTLEAAVKTQAKETGPSDDQPTNEAKLIAEALETVRSVSVETNPKRTAPVVAPKTPKTSFWVYLGAYHDGIWETNYFNLKKIPSEGEVIGVVSDIFKRDGPPIFKGNDWQLGTPQGVLSAGQTATVIQTKRIPGAGNKDLWWAEVSFP